MATILISRLLINLQRLADQYVTLDTQPQPWSESNPTSTEQEICTIAFAPGLSGQLSVIHALTQLIAPGPSRSDTDTGSGHGGHRCHALQSPE